MKQKQEHIIDEMIQNLIGEFEGMEELSLEDFIEACEMAESSFRARASISRDELKQK